MAGKKLKFGFHDFINAQPLLIPLREREQQLGVTLVTGSPARLAEQLRAGELDLAMIPSIEYLKDSAHYRLLSGVAVASRGPVGTVLFVSLSSARRSSFRCAGRPVTNLRSAAAGLVWGNVTCECIYGTR